MNIRELMTKELERCRLEVVSGGEIMPHFVAWTETNEMLYVCTPWPNEEAKVQILQMIKLLFLVKKVNAYVMTSEAWTVTRDVDTTDKRAPAECEDRKEIITMIGVQRGQSNVALSADIARDGDIVEVGEAKWSDYTIAGRMTELLAPEGIPELPPEDAAFLLDKLGSIFGPFGPLTRN